MHISIEPYDYSFNVCIHSAEGKEPFLVIKGCRKVEGKKGPFISWPAKKMDDGKYYNHVYSSEGFMVAALKALGDWKPKGEARGKSRPADDDQIPF